MEVLGGRRFLMSEVPLYTLNPDQQAWGPVLPTTILARFLVERDFWLSSEAH